jgi:hypothetical protein
VELQGEKMSRVLKIVAGLFAVFFILMGLRWAFDPSSAAQSLGMALLDGNALSTQIGDLGSFFITIGVFTLIGVITETRHWFYAPSMLLLVAALYRGLATLIYGAPFAFSSIIIEVVVGLFLIVAGSRISMDS